MIEGSAKFKGYRCFRDDWAGFERFCPINVIIGRNNSGKSCLLALPEFLTSKKFPIKGYSFKLSGVLPEQELKRVFQPNTSGGQLGGNHWESHGKWFLNVRLEWERSGNEIALEVPPVANQSMDPRVMAARREALKGALQEFKHPFHGRMFRHLVADRDVLPEAALKEMQLSSAGGGATNIIRRYINTSNRNFPRELIQRDLLQCLNQIFAQDGTFTEIAVEEHDDGTVRGSIGTWEVYLGQEHKDRIPLSASGSGLKTIILVLLNLLAIPQMEKKKPSDFVFAFEEPENNLHPALLRRLFTFLEDFAVANETHIFLTTHSNVALDVFGFSKSAQVVHVSHNGKTASTRTVSAHFDRSNVISELGAKPSDLLQANGVLWVEGPSDRIYLNRWIELWTDGKLQEGRDYQCAFFGGSLLARMQFRAPDEAESDKANLLQVNPNAILVADGDRTAAKGEGSRIKNRVSEVRKQILQLPNGYVWVTEGKEIENYLTGAALAAWLKKDVALPDPGKFESFFPSASLGKSFSFIEKHLKRKTIDKVELALGVTPHLDRPTLEDRFDLKPEIEKICQRIRDWNL